MRRSLYLIFWLVVIIVIATFALLNSHILLLNLYFIKLKVYLPLLLLLTLILGMLLGIILYIPAYWRCKRRRVKAEALVKKAHIEIENLRSIPLKDQY